MVQYFDHASELITGCYPNLVEKATSYKGL